MLAKEMMHRYCNRHGWQQGSVFYRIYPKPSADAYGRGVRDKRPYGKVVITLQ
jgi:hypothetical protein